MFAFEFETDTKDRVIEIPEQFRELANRHVRIIVMVDESQLGKPRMPGSAKGRINVADDFDKPLIWNEVQGFYGE